MIPILLIIFSVVMATDLELIPMPATTIDRQLFSIEEQEDSSIKVFDKSNGTQIAGFNNAGEMLEGMPKVINDMIGYYASKNLTDIIIIK